METYIDIFLDSLRTTVLITGLVVIMMMLIELVNINSKGAFFRKLSGTRIGQVTLSAVLGVIPGCMGGFASVSLYTHGMISFGALTAMMIASSGDEAFVMMGLFPGKSIWIFALLLVTGIATGLLVDSIYKPKSPLEASCSHMNIHEEDTEAVSRSRHPGWKRIVMFAGIVLFIAALLGGLLEHEHSEEGHEMSGSLLLNILSEEWMYWFFAILSLSVLAVLLFASDHFVDEHLWRHIIKRHLLSVFLWTFGALVAVGIFLEFFDLEAWVKGETSHTVLMIIIAALVGLIPQSGPHLVFVTMFAGGIIPLPVLLSSCISQDGHASLPLFAESKISFVKAKVINLLVAILVGCVAMIFC